MEIYLDTASIEEIKTILPWSIITGITTNQKIFSNEKGIDFKRRVMEILSLINAPLSVELTKTACKDSDLVEEAMEYASWNNNIVIKVPMWGDGRGMRITAKLKELGIKTNVTCLITTNQVLLASTLGATYASIFFNRVKDVGGDPVQVVQESRRIIDIGGSHTKIIVGSIRKPEDVSQAAVAGAHITTIPFKMITQMPYNSKTEETIKEFDQAWLEFLKTTKSAT